MEAYFRVDGDDALAAIESDRVHAAVATLRGLPVPQRAKKPRQPKAAKPKPKGKAAAAAGKAGAGGASAGAGSADVDAEKPEEPAVDEVTVNRAPVLTLWAAVVGARLGLSWDTALSVARVLCGRFARSKGRALGLVSALEPPASSGGVASVSLMGETFRVADTFSGPRALDAGDTVSSAAVAKYLERAFGKALGAVRKAMEELAVAVPLEKLNASAFSLYCRFRPAVAAGVSGWASKGTLSLAAVRGLALEQKGPQGTSTSALAAAASPAK
jgi:hypothetical protein